MTLQQQVPSLELCKKLKKLGYPQESLFYWKSPVVTGTDEEDDAICDNLNYFDWYLEYENDGGNYDYISAPTVAELGEMLPDEIEVKEQDFWLTITKGFYKWAIGWRKNGTMDIYYSQEAETEANARAKMMIYLLENKLITLLK